METSNVRKRMPVSALFDPKIVIPAIGSAFVKLDPRTLMKNPVMFVLEIVSALTTVVLIRDLVTGGENIAFDLQIVVWLWFTVLFANFAEAIAGSRQGSGRCPSTPVHGDAGQIADGARSEKFQGGPWH
jgi:K+-transporting ATPase ATPase B chain